MSAIKVSFTCNLSNVHNNQFEYTDYYSLLGNRMHGTFTLKKKQNKDQILLEFTANFTQRRCGYELYAQYSQPFGLTPLSKPVKYNQLFLLNTKKVTHNWLLWENEWERIKSDGKIMITIKYYQYKSKSNKKNDDSKQIEKSGDSIMKDTDYIPFEELQKEIKSWPEEYKQARLDEIRRGSVASMYIINNFYKFL